MQALRHPYVAQFHSPSEEPAAPHVITISMDDNTKVGRPNNPACLKEPDHAKQGGSDPQRLRGWPRCVNESRSSFRWHIQKKRHPSQTIL